MEGRSTAGGIGENIAACYLQLRGYHILERNYRNGPLELDLIAGVRDCLAFVEVKTRRCGTFGDAVDGLDRHKLSNIKKAATAYLSENESEEDFPQIRFDLIAIDMDVAEDTLKLTHLKGVG